MFPCLQPLVLICLCYPLFVDYIAFSWVMGELHLIFHSLFIIPPALYTYFYKLSWKKTTLECFLKRTWQLHEFHIVRISRNFFLINNPMFLRCGLHCDSHSPVCWLLLQCHHCLVTPLPVLLHDYWAAMAQMWEQLE